MSSRQLRKLQQQREIEKARLKVVEDTVESEDELAAPISKASLFASFAALEDGDEDEVVNDEAPEEALSPPKSPSLSASSFKKPKTKMKKKKKKKKKKAASSERTEEEPEERSFDDEIDRVLKELNIYRLTKVSGGINGSLEATTTQHPRAHGIICALISTESRHLKVGNEMRDLFGKMVDDKHDEDGGTAGRGAQRRQRGRTQQVDLETLLKGHHAPGKGLPEVTLRRNVFIQGKFHWPKATTGGLSMEKLAEAPDGIVEFRYIHPPAYQGLQQAFYSYVNIGDPQNLIGLLVKNPYHISLLLQVSKIAKGQDDLALAADLLERALFSFGRSATTLFKTKMSQGKARLDFSRPENRELWLAAYHYSKSLLMKGAYRTALEWAKLILSLDPRADHYCMSLMLHNLSLRACEFRWLLDLYDTGFYHEWDNFDRASASGWDISSHTRPSLAFAALQLRDQSKARELLATSMAQLPWLFVRLFSELNLDTPPSIWGIAPRTDAESLFTEIYVGQTKDLWNTPEATSLLMEIAHTIPQVDASKIPLHTQELITLNVARFVYLENTPKLMALVPGHLIHRSNNSDSDPLPPDYNQYSYESQRRAIEGHHEGHHDPAMGDLLAAFHRLIPRMRNNDEIRRELEDIIAEGEEVTDSDEAVNGDPVSNEEQVMPVSFVRRLINYLWANGVEEEVGLEEEVELEVEMEQVEEDRED